MTTSDRLWMGTLRSRSASGVCGLLVLACLALATSAPAGATWEDDTADRLKRLRFAGLPWQSDCWLYLPKGYDKTKRYGLVVVLHPAGLRGSRFAKIWGEAADRTGEFLVLAPECLDTGKRLWQMGDEALVVRTVGKALELFPCLDNTRVLLTGFSLGGNYAYLFGLRNPAKFRAIAVASGALKARPGAQADAILRRARHLPVYIVHGAQDPHVPVARARASRDRLEAIGYQVTYHERVQLGHFYAPGESGRIWEWFKQATAKRLGAPKRGGAGE